MDRKNYSAYDLYLDLLAVGPRRRALDRLVVDFVDGLVRFIARHWLALANLGLFAFMIPPLLAPFLMAAGYEAPARLIYLAYRAACHQLPSRSYFLFGPRPVYSAEELRPFLNPTDPAAFLGSPELGFKVAFCERDVAIYGLMLVAGLAYGLFRGQIRALDWRVFLVLILPLALDGTTQLLGLRESDWLLRTVTGGLFGVGWVWLAYPRVDRAMAAVLSPMSAASSPEPDGVGRGKVESPGPLTPGRPD
ncbi:MAG: hypothetical protein C4316_02880 [Chloroflexota bacterium]